MAICADEHCASPACLKLSLKLDPPDFTCTALFWLLAWRPPLLHVEVLYFEQQYFITMLAADLPWQNLVIWLFS